MLRKLSPLQIVGLVALLLCSVFITCRAETIEEARASHDTISSWRGKPAPTFSLDSLDGHEVALADYRGKKKVVISYWASWCGPCRVELPEMKRFYEKYHKDNSDFEFVAISIDDDRESAETYAQKAKLPFPVLLDLGHEAADEYSVEAIPATFIVDKDGKVKQTQTGLDETMEIKLAIELGVNLDTGAGRVGGKSDDDGGD